MRTGPHRPSPDWLKREISERLMQHGPGGQSFYFVMCGEWLIA
jgi:hypothetical protein